MTQHSQHGALHFGRERSSNKDGVAGCGVNSGVVSLSKCHTCAHISLMPDRQNAVKAAVSSFCRSVSDTTDDAVIQYLTGIVTDACEEGDADIAEIEELVHGFMPGISRLSQQECHDRLWTLLTQVSYYTCKPLGSDIETWHLTIWLCSRSMPFTIRMHSLRKQRVLLSQSSQNQLFQGSHTHHLISRAHHNARASAELMPMARSSTTQRSITRPSPRSAPSGRLTRPLMRHSWHPYWTLSVTATWR